MLALIRYSLGDTFRTQRWIAPVLCLVAIDAVACAQAGSALPTYGALATALLFVGTWLTVVVVNSEDPVQQTITEACAGSRTKVRLAKLLLGFVLCVLLGVLAMVPPTILAGGGLSIRNLSAGFFAQVIAALAAVALGGLCSRPIVRRHATSVLIGLLVGLAALLLPNGVPSRQLLVLFDKTGQFGLVLPMLAIGLETLVLCLVAIVVSMRLSYRRAQ